MYSHSPRATVGGLGFAFVPLIVMAASSAVSAIAAKKKKDAQEKKAAILYDIESRQTAKDPAQYGGSAPAGSVAPSSSPVAAYPPAPAGYVSSSGGGGGVLDSVMPFLPYAIGGVLLLTLLKKK